MNTENILRMAREAGMSVKPGRDGPWESYGTDHSVERFFKLAYEAGAAAERNRMISEGWRQCAQGQRTTQFCAVAEQARAEEREACAKVCEQSDEDGEGPDCWGWHSKDYAAAIRARSKT